MDRAIQYANSVVEGELIAGKLVIHACQRFLDDMKKQKTDDFPYYYSESYASKVIKFVESLPQTNGEPLELEPFEVFILSNIYGWRQVDDNSLRFNRILLSEARKNGKSFLLAAIGVVSLLMEKQPARNRQILFTANSSQQAHLAFDIMSDQLENLRRNSKYLRQRVKINKQRVADKKTGSFAIPLSTDTHSTDGYNPTLGVVDEYHQAKDNTILNALNSGMAQQDNGILAIISTAGFNLNSPFKNEWDYAADILNGKIKNDRYFAVMYCLDKKEEMFDPTMWIKANPLMSNPKIAKTMREHIQNDLDVATKQNNLNNVLVKNMNMFVQQNENSYISTQDWEHGLIEKAPDISNRDVYIGADLSKSRDLTAISWLVPLEDGKFYADSHAFVSRYGGIVTKSKRDGIDYEMAAKRGECSISSLESGLIDYDSVYDFVMDLIGKYNLNVKFLVFDPYKWADLVNRFERAGLPQLQLTQSYKNLSVPIGTFKEELIAGNILHTNNQMLAYNVGNAILKYNFNGQALLDKTRKQNKIDCLAALMDAWAAGYDYFTKRKEQERTNEYYETAKNLF
ncbi:terminase large subunit [Limosilactobacillus reuteri]|uniref:terminase large subunit n=1 Tax=Limosilactobacillus reuteri TaxID=1598 RepID=UPI001E3AC89E|nr:terminase TerL endonuclease subunit [Limosilactobacillus reuteri]MCC4440438.1 terminase large subunit [Limosilactobacillus reuteri]